MKEKGDVVAAVECRRDAHNQSVPETEITDAVCVMVDERVTNGKAGKNKKKGNGGKKKK